jgi:uncharacterized lipoprotein NlpE involved in copper resistance
MKKAITTLSFIIIIIMGCKREQTAVSPLPATSVKPSTTKLSLKINQLVKTDSLIDFDAAKGMTNVDKSITEPEYAKMRAATYRFYKNVKLVDGKYVYRGTGGGKSINLSDRVFTAFTNNLNDINKSIESQISKGQRIELPEVTDDYLNSLLK